MSYSTPISLPRTVVVRNPFQLMDEIMDRIAKDEFTPSNNVPKCIVEGDYPKCDRWNDRKDGSWHADVTVTGYTEDEVTVDYADNYFTVSVKAEDDRLKKLDEDREYIKVGISRKSGAVKLFIDSTKYDVSKTSVEFEGGLLSISVPMDKRYVTPRKFEINGGAKKATSVKSQETKKESTAKK
jgi:HSP20 family molecular chaperone IbpA